MEQTGVQLFRYDRKLTACALGEPSLTLVQNDRAFGLLLASGAYEDSFTARFYLDDVSYLHVSGQQCDYLDFASVAIFQRKDIWLAQDPASDRYFPTPRRRPYHVVFISQEEYQTLQNARAEGLGFPVFQAAQRHFGRLPGFSIRARSLETPPDYADRAEAVATTDYVLADAP